MLETIHIQGFKGFKDTHIGPLRKVNLVVGGQNVGKTSLLEAVWLAMAFDFTFPFRQMEGNDVGRLVQSAFDKNFQRIEIQYNGESRTLTNNVNPEGSKVSGTNTSTWKSFHDQSLQVNLFKTDIDSNQNFTPAAIPLHLPNQIQLVQLFGENVLARKKDDLIKDLLKVEPRLESLDAAAPFDIKEPRIYVGIHGIEQALPLPELGHGFARLLYVFCTLLRTDAKVALIDEVENGIHYSALPTLLQGIKNVAHDRDVQTLMTTHSWDCIRAACEVFADQPQDFQVIRLERTEDNIRAVCIDGERMLRLMSNDREVR